MESADDHSTDITWSVASLCTFVRIASRVPVFRVRAITIGSPA